MQSIDSTSLVYVQVPLTKYPYNPVGYPVQMAFQPWGMDASGAVYNTAAWQLGANVPTAICLVGPPTGVELSPGTYGAFVKIAGSPEIPVLGPFPVTIT